MPPDIRLASLGDLVAINDIYNYFVASSTCTYQEVPDTMDDRRAWFDAHGSSHPVVVAEQDDAIVGWGAISPYHRRSAYRFTVEDSVYVHPDRHRQGIGSLLLADLIARATRLEHRVIIAAIDAEQTHSIRLHQRQGFAEIGRMTGVGYKFSRWLDVVYLQRSVRA